MEQWDKFNPPMIEPQGLVDSLLDTHDRYRVEQLLAGRVYLAKDLFSGEVVALKLLRRLSSQQENVAFAYEMALYNAISNEYVVNIKDFGLAKAGCFFYTMEYIQGTPLSQLLNALTPDRALSIFKQICQALQSAHRGVVLPHWHLGNLPVTVPHQKIHPDHILVLEPEDRVKVINFGFISEADPNQAESPHNTLVTSIGGEFHYIAPEQLEKAEGVIRSDVYVLGMLLYEMLCGTNPYGVQVQNGLPWVMAHATNPPVPLRQRSGCHTLPVELEQIILKCLAKEPEQRYADAIELLNALEPIPKLQAYIEDNPTQPHIFDDVSRIIAEPDGTQTITLSAVPQDKTTLSASLQEASTLVDRAPETELGNSFRMGDTYNNYSTFLEDPPKEDRPPILLIAVTLGIVVSLAIFTGVVLWQRSNNPPSPPENPIDRSI